MFAAALLLSGCSTCRPPADPGARRFDFSRDTFAYANQLRWAYGFDTNGLWKAQSRNDHPDYTLHCFIVARSARQFFDNAAFAPSQPATDAETYRKLVRKVVSSNPRRPKEPRIVIPGFADLRSFSLAHEDLLKAECGGSWQCYFQRGNWRMVFPFARSGQEHQAERLLRGIEVCGPAVVHLVRFPKLSINHVVVLYAAQENDKEIRFTAYDPNLVDRPMILRYDRNSRTFFAPSSPYFPGGRVDVYEIYRNWRY